MSSSLGLSSQESIEINTELTPNKFYVRVIKQSKKIESAYQGSMTVLSKKRAVTDRTPSSSPDESSSYKVVLWGCGEE